MSTTALRDAVSLGRPPRARAAVGARARRLALAPAWLSACPALLCRRLVESSRRCRATLADAVRRLRTATPSDALACDASRAAPRLRRRRAARDVDGPVGDSDKDDDSAGEPDEKVDEGALRTRGGRSSVDGSRSLSHRHPRAGEQDAQTNRWRRNQLISLLSILCLLLFSLFLLLTLLVVFVFGPQMYEDRIARMRVAEAALGDAGASPGAEGVSSGQENMLLAKLFDLFGVGVLTEHQKRQIAQKHADRARIQSQMVELAAMGAGKHLSAHPGMEAADRALLDGLLAFGQTKRPGALASALVGKKGQELTPAQLERRAEQLDELATWLAVLRRDGDGAGVVNADAGRRAHIAAVSPDSNQPLAGEAHAALANRDVPRAGGLHGFAQFYHHLVERYDDQTIARLATLAGGGGPRRRRQVTDRTTTATTSAQRARAERVSTPGFSSAVGPLAREHKRLRPMDELELLKYRHAIMADEAHLGVHPLVPEGRAPADAADDLRDRLDHMLERQRLKTVLYTVAPSALNRNYFFPLQRYELLSPYAEEDVRTTDAWYTPVAAEMLYYLDTDARVEDGRGTRPSPRVVSPDGAEAIIATTGDDGLPRVREPANTYLLTGDPLLPLSLMQHELKYLSPHRLSAIERYLTVEQRTDRFTNRENMLEGVGNLAPLFGSLSIDGAAPTRGNRHIWRLLRRFRSTATASQAPDAQAEREALMRQLEAFVTARKRAAVDERTIFVSMASYRDVECAPTLTDLFKKALNPHRVFAGVAEQNREGDPGCLQDVLLSPPIPCYAPVSTRAAAAAAASAQLAETRPRVRRLARLLYGSAKSTTTRGGVSDSTDDARFGFAAQQRAYGLPPGESDVMAERLASHPGARRLQPPPGKLHFFLPYHGGVSAADRQAHVYPSTPVNDFGQRLCSLAEHVRIRRVHSDRAYGPTFGRYMAMLLYRGESLTLVIDSHNRFVPFWDSLGANMFFKFNDERVGLSHYPESYGYADESPQRARVEKMNTDRAANGLAPLDADDEEEELQVGYAFSRKSSAYLCKTFFLKHLGYLRLNGIVVGGTSKFYSTNRFLAPYYRPTREEAERVLADPGREAVARRRNYRMPQPWIAGGFLFTSYHLFREVPFDPHLPQIFDGEEVLFGMRMWTHGFTLFSPEANLCYHFYTRSGAPKVWDESAVWHRLQGQSRRRVQYFLRSHMENNPLPIVNLRDDRDFSAGARAGLQQKPRPQSVVLVDADRFGTGRVRRVDQWYEFAGVDPVSYKIEGRFCGLNS